MTGKLRWNSAGAALILIMALGAGVAFYRLGARSLWFDEITGARVAELRSAAEIVAAGGMDSHPPAMALAEHGSRWAFGLSEWSLRMPAALSSVGALAAVATLAWGWGERRVGWLAAVLAAFSPVFVTFAQDARPYAMAMLFTAWASASFFFAFRNRFKCVWFPLYGVFAALSLYAHYFTTLVIASHVLIAGLGWFRAFRPAGARRVRAYAVLFTLFVVAAAAAAGAAYPIFLKAISDRARFPGSEMAITPALLWGALAGVGWDRAAANALFAFSVVAGAVALARRGGRFIAAAAVILVAVPVFLPVFIVRFTTQFWHPRFCYFGMPAVMTVAAFGFVALARRLACASRRSFGAAALAAVFIAGGARAVADDVLAFRVFYDDERQDFRGAVAFVNRNRDWRSTILAWPFRNGDCYYFYTKTVGGPAAMTRPRTKIYECFADGRRVFLVSTDAEFDDELTDRYPGIVRFRFARIAVLYRDASYTTPQEIYKSLPGGIIAEPPGILENALGRLALKEGDSKLALHFFEAGARKMGPENPDIFLLTDLYVDRGQYRRAAAMIRGYVRRHPNEAWPDTKLAEVYTRLGDKDAAISCYRRALWLDPAKETWRRRMEELISHRGFRDSAFAYAGPRWF